MIQFADIKDFKYILKNLNEQKLDGKYVTVFDAKEYENAMLCLNCNKRGHLIDDCPNSIIYSETVEEKSIGQKSKSGHQTVHSRVITIYEPTISSEKQQLDDENDIDTTSIKQSHLRELMVNTSNKCDNNNNNNSDSNSDGIEIQKALNVNPYNLQKNM